MKKLFLIVIPTLLQFSFTAASTPLLSSLPSAPATLYLDFDGYLVQSSSWNGGLPLDCAPSGLTDAQIIEIFNRVAEDYRPFNINITTDSSVFLAASLTKRMRIIITPTSGWYTGVGGVAYTGSFTWGDDTPGFVFPDRLGPNNTKMVAECCSHEAGHTVGLSHQSTYDSSCNLLDVYNLGGGTGQTGWAPIMGDSYYKNFSGWYNGPTPEGCSSDEDALTVITTTNGFTYRPDDHSDDPSVNPTPISINNNVFADSGIISTSTDKDAFKFNLTLPGELHLDANPFSVGPHNEGADLDVKLSLLDSAFRVLHIYASDSILNASLDTVLQSGVYYLVVDGTGNSNTSNYGSLGSYNLSGSYTPLSTLAVNAVTLQGAVNNGKSVLQWYITSDEPGSAVTLESSPNGVNFSTVTALPAGSVTYSFTPAKAGEIYYRIKVVYSMGQTIYSNVIALKIGEPNMLFKVSKTTNDQVTIHAAENYNYRIVDMTGRTLQAGQGTPGMNTINISNTPNGIYLFQITSNDQRLTERIVRL